MDMLTCVCHPIGTGDCSPELQVDVTLEGHSPDSFMEIFVCNVVLSALAV